MIKEICSKLSTELETNCKKVVSLDPKTLCSFEEGQIILFYT